MDNFDMLFYGLQVVLTPQNILVTMVGAILGLIVGAMPGIGSLAGVALLLPLTYKFNPVTAIIMLGALYYSNMYGGAYSAILLNIPGDSPAIMTALDGYPMATKRGRPGQALFAANLASFVGGTVGIIILTFVGPWLAEVGLKFGPTEMTALLLVALTSIGWLLGDNPIKGIIITLLGILLASIGMDTLTGSPRFEFGSMYLMGGIPFIPFVIGMVGFAEIIKLSVSRYATVKSEIQKMTIRGSIPTKEELLRILPPALRSGFLGTIVGVLPGSGATMGSFLSYAFQKAFKSKYPYGTGTIEGIAASEGGNNGAAAGSFAPLLALGIPGSGTGAVLLGGLIMWGLNPGPLLFTKAPEFAWGLIASLYIANIFTLIVGLSVIPFLMRILKVPLIYMIPTITTLCIVGSYSSGGSMYNVFIMLISGVLGYLMQKFGYSPAPLLLAFVLEPLLENNLRKSLIISNGDPSIFFGSTISSVLMVIFFALLILPAAKAWYKKHKA
jgi:putative tricarboxylic transport membrane protein